MCKPYIEAQYLAPVFTSKPIIITLFWPEANPCNKVSQSIIPFQLFFPEKFIKAKAQARALAYSCLQVTLWKEQVFSTWWESNNLKYFVISHNFTIECFTYWP